jgi:hypothetical protein
MSRKKVKINRSDIDELISMSTLYNHWSIESTRHALYEIANKLKEIKKEIE